MDTRGVWGKLGSMPRRILLVPIGAVEPMDLNGVREVLTRELEWLGLKVYLQVVRENPPLTTFVWDRMQYDAVRVNEWLHNKYRFLVGKGYLIVGVCGCDAYVEGLNFVFGLATPGFGIASVYTRRLEVDASKEVFLERLCKEVLHETGHLLGLGHCRTSGCVMNFSNSVAEVDEKEPKFCPKCREKLASLMS